jgi:DNA adenine methylase
MAKLGSLFPWVGGKRILRNDIIARFPLHTIYIEAFAGGAWVYWGKEPSKVEVINDINGDLINLYKVLQKNPDQFYDQIYYMLASRQQYYDVMNILEGNRENISDVERAVYFYFSIKNAFGGRYGGGFAFSRRVPPRSAIRHETLVAVTERLSNTYIENLSYERLIKNYDHAGAFFYCDPPYVVADGKNYYQFAFTEEDHKKLASTLMAMEGKFLLSYDDVPIVRDLYKGCKITKTKPVLYTLNQKHKYKTELLIQNY